MISGDVFDRDELRILWINSGASAKGGAEQYVHSAAAELRRHGVSSSLLYDADSIVDSDFLTPFQAAFPLVDPASQVAALRPDVVFVHQLRDERWIDELAGTGAPVARFFHDHRLCCPREHKYTALGHKTCTRTVGLGCYALCGGLERRNGMVQIRTVASLRRDHRRHDDLAAHVVGSQYMRRHLEAHGFPKRRIHVVPLFASEPTESPRPARRGILFAGALTRGKGVDVLLEAATHLQPRASLTLVGDGPQRGELERETRRLGLTERVRFVGSVSHRELGRHLAEAECVVVPSRSPETFGLVGLEALARGTPVVASAVGGTSEWLRHEENGLAVPSGDPVALAGAIERLLADPAWASELGARGRHLWSNRFRPEHHALRLVRIFADIRASRRAA
jgi:glycosyltransferase involved in cell wall biosynthesis